MRRTPTIKQISQNLNEGLAAAKKGRKASDEAYEKIVERMNAEEGSPIKDDKPEMWPATSSPTKPERRR